MMTLISEWAPDPIGVSLGTGFMRFKSPFGITGLARVRNGQLDLLMLIAENPGRGHLRHFIERAKLEYSAIAVLDIWHGWLRKVLERYGFTPYLLIEDDEEVKGMIWRATP